MPHAYTEDQLVEQSGIGLFAELGWTTVSALEEVCGPSPTALPFPLGERRGEGSEGFGRETPSQVALGPQLRSALERLNPALPPGAIIAGKDNRSALENLYLA